MRSACEQLQCRKKHNTAESEFLVVTVSYDGAYQKGGGEREGYFYILRWLCYIRGNWESAKL